MSSDKVKVAVRVRPFNRREIDLGTKCVVDMDPTQTMLYHPSTGTPNSKDGEHGGGKKAPKTFAFDHCFWSMEDSNPKFSGQEKVFKCLGEDILERAFEGYNACIFAYGQTGSGKTYTMMGAGNEKGLIPRLCDGLFLQIAKITDNTHSCKVEVSYMEIYNEKVHDLLDPKGGKQNLRVREHNILGPYVDGLSLLVVNSFEDVINLMSEGNKSRTVAATNMNNESSRSHAVFNLIVTQTLTDLQSGVSGEKVSKLSLVDLAGSERAQKTGAVGERLKEGSNINKSLTTLGLVISALADQGASKPGKKHFVPYRDSVLTWLLKDNLGGNSKTVMVATLSPAADNYEETLSTLRYADRAKRIVQHAVVNEDPNARIIRELREEVDVLKKQLDQAQSMKAEDLKDRLEESEKLVKELTKTWEEKLAETERIHNDRHNALEQMGISVQTSGIKVEQGKYFLVNLNADPSLNELLVYYLKERTLVGKHAAPVQQDIQLSGLGISPQHCVVEIDGTDVYITPLENSRTCVNGCTVNARTKVKHGDRILWGNNHFFRLSCPKANTPTSGDPETPIDYDFAQQELMMKQFGDDPIQEAITAIEKQHEEEKLEALEKQRLMYERQMQMLRNQLMSPNTPSQPFPAFDFARMMSSPGTSNPNIQNKYQQWAQERNKLFKQNLAKLKEEMVKANTLVREANFLAQEMGKQTEFQVTLQIPAANLSPNRKRGTFVSEPAILVKRKSKGSQIWSMEKFENKIIDMREMYEDRKERGVPMMDQKGPPVKGDPFYESQENHNLIGVANVFLEALFYDVKLDYHVPIISQQGEVSGRLHVELSRIAGMMPERQRDSDMSSESSGESGRGGGFEILDDENGLPVGATVDCRVCIREARGLPPALSNFVFCQYTYWGYPEPIVVPPIVDPEGSSTKRNDGVSFRFDHRKMLERMLGKQSESEDENILRFDHWKEFRVGVTEEFVEHCADGALSIEVWGHRSLGFSSELAAWEMERMQAKSRSLTDRWSELSRKIEVWVEIHELNEQGEYMPVEVLAKPEVLTGGIFQLRQGHSRRIMVRVKPVHNSGTLPIICETITHVSIGCVCARSKLQKGLDSYQEEDLNVLRDKWSEALSKRRDYLDEQLQRLMNKGDEKSDADIEREKSLIEQWVGLTEERNAVLVPAAGSGIPGAPADWDPDMGMEEHIPVLFLDLNADDMSTPNAKEGLQAAGMNSILPKEHGTKFYTLPFVKTSEKDVCAVVSWDSSIHDSVHLNRITPSNERVYLILKTVVRLSHPASMELVLRKRICINVYKKQSLTDKLKKRISKVDMQFATGVSYEVVSNIPKASEDLEDRESLAQLAASQNEADATADGETYIEKYIKGVSAVESILTLDKLRQEVAIKELLAKSGRPLRKATSVPNIHNAGEMISLRDLLIISSPNTRMEDQVLRADSIQDLYSREEQMAKMQKRYSLDISLRNRVNSDNGLAKDISPQGKVPGFSLTRPNFLNLRSNPLSHNVPSPKSAVSPQPGKLVKPMKTLMEEQHMRESKPLLDQNDESDDDLSPLKSPDKSPERECASPSSDDFQEFTSYQPVPENTSSMTSSAPQKIPVSSTRADSITHSSTSDSLAEVPAKNFTPSMTSSGYDSQAVSTQTLSSEDSASVRSMSIEEVQDDMRNKSMDKSDSSSDHDDNRNNKSMEQSAESSDHDQVLTSTQSDLPVTNSASQELDKTSMLENHSPEVTVIKQSPSAGENASEKSTNDNGEDNKAVQEDPSTAQEGHQSQRECPADLAVESNVSDRTGNDTEKMETVLSPMDMDIPSNIDQPTLVPVIPEQPAEHNQNTDSSQAAADGITAAETCLKAADTQLSIGKAAEPIMEAVAEQDEQSASVTQTSAATSQAVGETEPVTVVMNNSVDTAAVVAAASPDDAHSEDELTGTNSSAGKEEVVDVYSETAMEELEKLGDSPNEDKTSVPEKKVQEKTPAIKTSTNKTKQKKSAATHSEERDKFDEKPRRNNSFNDRVRRRSVDDKEKQMQKSTSTDDISKTEVKLRKTANLEASRPVSLRKMRPGDRSGKTAPSPVKATYRPVSMPVEMAMALTSGEIDIMGSADDNNSDEDAMSVCSFGSRADLNRLGETPLPAWIQVGEPVLVLSSQGGPNKSGTVMFTGQTEFAGGNWVGVELDTPDGKNDGSVKGIRYFKCRNRHGIFVRHDKLIMDKKRGGRKVRNVPSTLRRSTGNLTTTNARSREVLTSSGSAGSFMKPTSASAAKSK